ncbi:MAG: phosphate acyltransferase PlsX [Chitinivibrionales bacterium]|nr:phosphate acyltransferase PlsX [Chitinivibrionales bacterium]
MGIVRLAIDVVGGDYGPGVVIRGAVEAKLRSGLNFSPLLCGKREQIEHIIKSLESSQRVIAEEFDIEHCPEIISGSDTPARAWKTKKNSSIVRCVALQKEGKVNASISAGDTGTLLGAAVFLLGRSESVARPALAAFLPTIRKRPSLMLDVGANLDCRVEHLVTFGLMGFEYYQKFFAIKTPQVFLLNIGKEPFKGTRTLHEADRLLRDRCRGYRGFIEGSRVLSGDADIIVCDGFAGNVLLKACESFHGLVAKALGDENGLFEAVKQKMAVLNSENYGAVPLLGIKGIVMKAHGSSSSTAIARAIETSVMLVRKNGSSQK